MQTGSPSVDRIAVGETELVAVEVIALGDLVADFQRLAVEGTHAGLEGNGRVEELVGVGQGNRAAEEEKEDAHGHVGVVSAASQFR